MSAVLIVGGGPYVKFVARDLVSRGHRVTALVGDPAEGERLGLDATWQVIVGDGTKPTTLAEAGAAEVDRVFALTPRDQDNFLICMLARHRFQTPSVFALVHDPENEAAFRALGIADTFPVTEAISTLIGMRAAAESIRNLQPFADGRFGLAEAELGAEAPALGKALAELALPKSALFVSVVRDGEAIIPRGDTRLALGDRVGFIFKPEEYSKALAAIVGKD